MKRDWSAAREKCDREGACRNCGALHPEAAHLWPRGMGGGQSPDLIVPLCRPCHARFDAHLLDVLALLTHVEQAELVAAAGGIESARRRVLPSEYRRVA